MVENMGASIEEDTEVSLEDMDNRSNKCYHNVSCNEQIFDLWGPRSAKSPDGEKRMAKITKLKINDLILKFLAFGVIGWIYEVCIMWLEMHEGFVNRGFLYGPWLPIYGLGGIGILLLFGRLRKKWLAVGKLSLTPIVCFCLICLLATALELGASYLVEGLLGHTLWDYRYTNYGPTFQGRIAVRSTLQFGLIGIAVLYILCPLLERSLDRLHKKVPALYWGGSLLTEGAFLVDLIYHLIHGSNALW